MSLINDGWTTMDTAPSLSPWHSSDMPPAAAPVSPCESETSGGDRDVEDRYAVDPRVLGAGHCGSVRACTDWFTGRRCAIKSVRKDDPAVTLDGLAREVALLREMDHPSVLRFVDVYEDDAYVHIVTELCAGGELFDRIVDDDGAPALAEDAAARVLRQVLAAVAHLHARGVAHRDVKPENILFASPAADAPVKLVDFGLAKRHACGRKGAPKMRSRVGTPYYMAPEVLRHRYDEACDLWSVGVVAYILLCGYPPFNGRTDEEVFEAICRGRCHFSKRDWSGVSWEGRDFVRRLLQKEPEKRMTAQQALEHPWIRKHADDDEEMRDDRSSIAAVEVVYHRSRADSIIFGDTEAHKVGKDVLC